MTDDPVDLRKDRRSLRRAAQGAGFFVVLIWLVWLLQLVFELPLPSFGVLPREASGLPGVLLAPLIHGSFGHVFSNTLPLFILGSTLLYAYPRSALLAIPAIYLGSGLAVWLFARSSYHIGASGLNYGMLAFLCVIGMLRRDRRSIAISLAVLFLYGGMIWGVLPTQAGISFEFHLFGALIGIGLAVLLRRQDPAPPAQRYDWEGESEEGQ